ncbi:MAG TPA: D-alanyl-D-alanine carboxypeptidase [Baekduia sp.]|uniref:D-alanyl-D-alanine carboxypeptidase/D-alanyl-D-alanine-endopeptidase n=1 Tax=Baekduia sp. TaxID=2600305 RepID=UPI002CA6592B|nr:D-alanyl-D-alanine carboxypeptidase [Baekduia sp.]HMJ33637.1 D-alanyl-D-alanine carboxypeptidase [Baekduia sp.]
MRLPHTVLLTAAALATAIAAAPASAATSPDRTLTSDLTRLAGGAGGRGGFVVLDGAGGKTLAASKPDRVAPLGSTAKLLTTGAALDALGPSTALATEVVTAAGVTAGTLNGDLVLRGGGDPTLDEPQLARLADAVQALGVTAISGSVVGDETRFDALRGGPATSGAFDLELQGSLGALTYARGRQAPNGPLQPDPARAAAFRFDDVLEARGIVVRGTPRAGATPPGAVVVGRVSTPITAVVKATNKVSDDFYAETLAKDLSAAAGTGPGSTAAGAALAAAHAKHLGATLSPVDGSGVDTRTRGSARQLARYVRRMRTNAAFAASLPVAGVDGTLATRMTRGKAHRVCRAKTGSLPQTRVSALAGWCRVGGRTLVFAILRDHVGSQAAAKAAEDAMVQRLAGGPAGR